MCADDKLTAEEQQLLRDVIDMYIEGQGDAMTETISDRSIGKMGDLLELTAGYEETTTLLRGIQHKLCKGN